MIYRLCRPQVLHRNGQFQFVLQIFARGEGGRAKIWRTNWNWPFPCPGPLISPLFIFIDSKLIHFPYCPYGSLLSLRFAIVPTVPYCPYGSLLSWFPIVLDPYCPGSLLSRILIVLDPYCPGSLLSWIHIVLDPDCPGSRLSWIHFVLVPFCPGSILSWILFVLDPFCPVLSCQRGRL